MQLVTSIKHVVWHVVGYKLRRYVCAVRNVRTSSPARRTGRDVKKTDTSKNSRLWEEVSEQLRLRHVVLISRSKVLNLEPSPDVRWMIAEIYSPVLYFLAFIFMGPALTWNCAAQEGLFTELGAENGKTHLSLSNLLLLHMLSAVCLTKEPSARLDTTIPSTKGVDKVMRPTGPCSLTRSNPLLSECRNMINVSSALGVVVSSPVLQ